MIRKKQLSSVASYSAWLLIGLGRVKVRYKLWQSRYCIVIGT
jgi:hypothetical protein